MASGSPGTSGRRRGSRPRGSSLRSESSSRRSRRGPVRARFYEPRAFVGFKVKLDLSLSLKMFLYMNFLD